MAIEGRGGDISYMFIYIHIYNYTYIEREI